MPNAVILKALVRIFTLAALCVLWVADISAQEKPAYELFSGKGKRLRYKDVLTKLAQADVILFGEQHNDPIAHWLEYEFAADLIRAKGKRQVVVGMEMLETHWEPVLAEYMSKKISAKAFRATEGMWENYSTDYEPLVALCRDSGVAVVATNVPRKYAALVAKQGLAALDTLSAGDKSLLAPLPITVPYDQPSYQLMREMMGGHGHGSSMKPENFVAAQALKDATMAHNILRARKKDGAFYHLNGAFHSDRHEGIVWYLKQAEPQLRVVVISTVSQVGVTKLAKENRELGDIILVVPETMTKTY